MLAPALSRTPRRWSATALAATLLALTAACGGDAGDGQAAAPDTGAAAASPASPAPSGNESSTDSESPSPEPSPTGSSTAIPPDLPDLDFPTDWQAIYLADCKGFEKIETRALLSNPAGVRWSDAPRDSGVVYCFLTENKTASLWPSLTLEVVPEGGYEGEYRSFDSFAAAMLLKGFRGYGPRPAPVAGPWDFGVYDSGWIVGNSLPADYLARLTYVATDSSGATSVVCEYRTDSMPIDADRDDPRLRELLEPVIDAVVPYTDEVLTACTEALSLTSYPLGAVE